ncbi:MAG: hypothetical protein R2764_11125 [Bacteroidales bacterium]
MKKLFHISFATALILCSCKESDEVQPSFDLTGNYSGTFSRTNVETGWNCVSDVSLSLSDSTFSGSSEQHYFPAMCAGNIEIGKSTIIFQNTCVWPAHFDWSLILSEDWNWEGNENQLRIWKDRGNIKDEYLICK